MASTFSNLKIQLMATGENAGTWGNTTNLNLGTAIEQALVETATVTFASGNVTLTLTNSNSAQNARALRLNLAGTTAGARDLIVPAIQKPYIVNNGTADIITVKNAAGTGIAVPAGKSFLVYNNGTNVVNALDGISVESGGTGLNTLTNNSVIIGNTTSAVKFVAPGTSGNVLTSNGTVWTSSATSIISQGNSNVTVTDAGTGKIEFTVDAVEVADFTTAAVVFNEGGANQDFRIEGDTDANLLFVDASTDRVGIGTNTPDALLSVDGIASFGAGSASTPSIAAAGDLNTGIFFSAANTVDIATDGVARAQINSAGDFAINAGFGSVGKAYLCRAWVNFDGTGTPAIRASGNVSSITDNGTGNYTVNFTTAMPDANYAVMATGPTTLSSPASVGTFGVAVGGSSLTDSATSRTTTEVRMKFNAHSGASTFTQIDVEELHAAIFR